MADPENTSTPHPGTPTADPDHVHSGGRLTVRDARYAGAMSALYRLGGYCAMPHPTDGIRVCNLHAGHEGHHRDWYKRETPIGPYLDWTDDDYA